MAAKHAGICEEDQVELERLASLAADSGVCVVQATFDILTDHDADPTRRGAAVLDELFDLGLWPFCEHGRRNDAHSKIFAFTACTAAAIDSLREFPGSITVEENTLCGLSGYDADTHPAFRLRQTKLLTARSTDDIRQTLIDCLEGTGLSYLTQHFGVDSIWLENAGLSPKAPLTQAQIDSAARSMRQADCRAGLAVKIARRTPAGISTSGRQSRFLVPGLIPKGAITLLPARMKSGKSALALELAATVGGGGGNWCGFEIPNDECKGLPLFLSGEDPDTDLVDRMHRLLGEDSASPVQIIPAKGIDQLRDTLADYDGVGVPLLVVDPARSFCQGDEDGSSAANELFQELQSFAQAKNCAVLVTHHLRRNAEPRSLADVARMIRGSQVFLDRPRSIVGLVRQKGQSLLGIPTFQGTPLCNFQREMFVGERRLRFDPQTERHLPIESSIDAHGGRDRASETEKSAVARAIIRMSKGGIKITRTGSSGLYERKPEEIDGIPRAHVRNAVGQLLEGGMLRQHDAGTLEPDSLLEEIYG